MGKFTVFHTFVYRARAFDSAFTAPTLADHKTPKSNGGRGNELGPAMPTGDLGQTSL
mgnify:CR=1 FL=1